MKTTAIWCTALMLATVELSAAGTDFDSFLQPDPFVQANAAFARGEAAAAESIIAPITQGTAPRADSCEPRVLTRLVRTAEARTCYEKILVDFPGWEPARTALAALSPAS